MDNREKRASISGHILNRFTHLFDFCLCTRTHRATAYRTHPGYRSFNSHQKVPPNAKLFKEIISDSHLLLLLFFSCHRNTTSRPVAVARNEDRTRRCSQPLAASLSGLRGPSISRRSPDKLARPFRVAELDVSLYFMSTSGSVLFSDKPYIRWVISPFVVLTMIILPICSTKWTPESVILMASIELLGIAFLIGLWSSGAIQNYSLRFVTALVLAFYLYYFIHEWFFSGHSFVWNQPRGESSPKNSLLAMFIIGLPCLWFTIFGRFTFRSTTHNLDNVSKTDE